MNKDLDTKSQSYGKPDMVENHELKHSEELLCYKAEVAYAQIKESTPACIGHNLAGMGEITIDNPRISLSNNCERKFAVHSCDEIMKFEENKGKFILAREDITTHDFLDKGNFVGRHYSFEDSEGFKVCYEPLPVKNVCPAADAADAREAIVLHSDELDLDLKEGCGFALACKYKKNNCPECHK